MLSSMFSAGISSKAKSSCQRRRRRTAAGLAPVDHELAVALCVSFFCSLVTLDSLFLGYGMMICDLMEEEEEDAEGADSVSAGSVDSFIKADGATV